MQDALTEHPLLTIVAAVKGDHYVTAPEDYGGAWVDFEEKPKTAKATLPLAETFPNGLLPDGS